MLRASSLGLNSPPPSIFTNQLCRRLSGANSHYVRRANATGTAVPISSRAKTTCPSPPNTSSAQNENFRGRTMKPHLTLESSPSTSQPCKPHRNRATNSRKQIQASSANEQTRDIPEEENPTQHEDDAEGQNKRDIPSPSGRPWQREPIKPIQFPLYLKAPLHRMVNEINETYKQLPGVPARIKKIDGEDPIYYLNGQLLPYKYVFGRILRSIRTLGTTDSVEEAWEAYVYLSDLITATAMVTKYIPHIPFSHLHRLCRLLSQNRPKTHAQFLRLLAVLTYIKHHNGTIHVFEWNALLDHAGKGWRKTRPEDVKHAVSIFNDMRMGRMPGAVDFLPPEAAELADMYGESVVEPNIVTYTTLLSHAAGAMDNQSIKDISAMMSKAGLAPNRITYLALLRYFVRKQNLGGVRSTLEKMRGKNFEIGLDGLNSCIWAYGMNNRLDIVMMIYRVLRHNHIPEDFAEGNSIDDITKLLEDESIYIRSQMQPNHITYISVIQVFAYHGHFDAAINVFLDMVSSENLEEGAPIRVTGDGKSLVLPYRPTFPVFRALFLGFYRHAGPHSRNPTRAGGRQAWTLHKLQSIFDLFLQLPPETEINQATLFLILKAFQKASGRNVDLMRSVWDAMEKQFKVKIKPNSTSRLAILVAEISRGSSKG